jgi:hypothetical protein
MDGSVERGDIINHPLIRFIMGDIPHASAIP